MSAVFLAGANPAPSLRRFGAARDVRHVVRSLLEGLAAWHAAKRRAAADREALVNMSDRELLDLGIPRGSVDAAADRTWARDYPYCG